MRSTFPEATTTATRLCQALAATLIAALAAGCGAGRDDHDHAELTTGEQLFNHHCAKCHGEDGTGRLVDRTPANILTRKDAEGIVDYLLTDTGNGRKMPVFATMPRGEAYEIADYLLELRQRYFSLPENRHKNRELLIDPEKVKEGGR